MTDETHAPEQTGSTLTASPEVATIDWLRSEFPGWQFDLDETATWQGDARPLWIASRGGHHPQSELTAAKLHTRLTEYLEREARRTAFTN